MAATNFEKTVKGEKFWSFSSVFLIKSKQKWAFLQVFLLLNVDPID